MKKLLSLFLCFVFLFQSLAPIVVLAQEAPIDATENVVSTESTPPSTTEPQPSPSPDGAVTSTPSPESSPAPSPGPTPAASAAPSPVPTESPQPEITPPPSVEPSPSPSEAPLVTSEASDSAALTKENTVESTDATPSAQSTTQTGDVVAVVENTTVVNTTLENSELCITDITATDSADTDLTQLACENQEPVATLSGDLLLDNDAQLGNEVDLTADTGNNATTTDGDATMSTGDAIALVNLLTLANISATDSEILMAIVNILPDSEGNVILPRPDKFLDLVADAVLQKTNGSLDLRQTAAADNQVSVESNTGGNDTTAGEENVVLTGETIALINLWNFLNQVVCNGSWYGLLVNVAGDWSGELVGWEGENSSQKLDQGSHLLVANDQTEATFASESGGDIGIDQDVEIDNDVNVQTNTGYNSLAASGSAYLKTGDAITVANIINWANMTFMNSRIFLGVINILGDWTGNIFFAYPELAVQIEANKAEVPLGETVTYTLHYRNQGYDEAEDVQLQLQLPEGAEAQGPTQWDLGTLQRNQSGSVSVPVKITNWNSLSASQPEKPWWQNLVGSAHAATEQRQFLSRAQITTSAPQLSTKHNQVDFTTVVYQMLPDALNTSTELSAERTQQLKNWPLLLTVEHNVNEYVHPGDVVTYTATIENQGDEPLKQVVIRQLVLAPDGSKVAEMNFTIGELPAHKRGQLSFGLQVPKVSLQSSVQIQTQTIATARTIDGSGVSSQPVTRQFLVRPVTLGQTQTVVAPALAAGEVLTQAEPAAEGEVLGAQVAAASARRRSEPWWVLALVLSMLGVTRYLRLKQRGFRFEWEKLLGWEESGL